MISNVELCTVDEVSISIGGNPSVIFDRIGGSEDTQSTNYKAPTAVVRDQSALEPG